MNSKQFATRVDQVAKAFAKAGVANHARVLLSIADFLREIDGIAVQSLPKQTVGPFEDHNDTDGPTGAEAASACAAALHLCEALEAKKAVAADFSALSAFFSAHRGANIEQLKAALKVDIVDQYARNLNAALGDPSFDAIFAMLSSDKRVRQAEAAAIASVVVAPTAKSAKKADSLRRIKARHDNRLDSLHKRELLRDKSAA
ncbi:MAG: hypothetical protein NW215_02340 [Hyphomicrobiales bacterium]|nr:hypothetical protein [Hyphomicrobiales bacterium]